MAWKNVASFFHQWDGSVRPDFMTNDENEAEEMRIQLAKAFVSTDRVHPGKKCFPAA
jgi:hypothetical protein